MDQVKRWSHRRHNAGVSVSNRAVVESASAVPWNSVAYVGNHDESVHTTARQNRVTTGGGEEGKGVGGAFSLSPLNVAVAHVLPDAVGVLLVGEHSGAGDVVGGNHAGVGSEVLEASRRWRAGVSAGNHTHLDVVTSRRCCARNLVVQEVDGCSRRLASSFDVHYGQEIKL